MSDQPLRFGVSVHRARSGDDLGALAHRLEDQGFDSLHTADHLGMVAPFSMLAVAAGATTSLRFGTLVVNNDFWNPVLLAREAASLAVLSGGRFELGIGAGHAAVEYEAAGLSYDRPAVRISRMAETIDVMRRLLDGEEVDFAGAHHRLVGASTGIETPGRVPLLVGGNGDRVLALAGRHADTAGLTGFTSGTGQSHSDLSHFTWAGLQDRIDHVRAAAAAGPRRDEPGINILVQQVVVGERAPAAESFAGVTGHDPAMLLDSPFLLLGSVAEIVGQCERLQSLGVTSVAAFDARGGEDLAPVIDALR